MPIHRRFRRIPHEKRRILLLFFVLMMLGVTIAALFLTNQPPQEEPAPTPADTSVQLVDASVPDVVSITIRRGSEAPWTATVSGETVVISGESALELSLDECNELLHSAASIVAEDVLTDDPADYIDHLADYGLEQPRYEARIVYADGRDMALRVGDKGHDGTWRYMLVSGDDRLFAFSNGSVESLFVNRDTLRKVSQPSLHKARIDRITLTEGEQVVQWTLTGDITDTDAADKWRITAPFTYPADAKAMENLLSSLANLRLGAYVCPATQENLTKYGFDTPRLTIDIHMAAGTMGTTNADGAVETADYPESTITFVIGNEKSDMIDYVRCGDSIYISSHFTVGVFMGYDVTATMSRYPVMTALGNLAKLTIREEDALTEYVLTRTEQVAANNELITDEEGSPVYTVTVTKNGDAVDYAAFEAAYNALSLVTVSGILPTADDLPIPHTSYTFTDVDGTVHTVELATFDVLHDAVIVDGHAAFYLIKGGFRLSME